MTLYNIIVAISYRNFSKVNRVSLGAISQNELTSKLFLIHCTHELCAENYLFYQQSLKWKREARTVSKFS